MEKLKSRKLWVSVLGAMLSVLAPAIGIPAEAVSMAINLLMLFVGGQSVVDAVKELKQP